MIKVGIAVGVLSWQTFNETYGRNFGGSVQNNLFKSGSTGYFGYGLYVLSSRSYTSAYLLGSIAALSAVTTAAP